MASLGFEALVDANILIRLFKGGLDIQQLLESLECGIDTTIYVELIQGAKDFLEVVRIEKALKTFPLIHFSSSISERTIALIRTYSKSHGLLLADALIAATCLENNLKLITFNVRDFRFIKSLRVEAPKQ